MSILEDTGKCVKFAGWVMWMSEASSNGPTPANPLMVAVHLIVGTFGFQGGGWQQSGGLSSIMMTSSL
jgi:hypothetical protein